MNDAEHVYRQWVEKTSNSLKRIRRELEEEREMDKLSNLAVALGHPELRDGDWIEFEGIKIKYKTTHTYEYTYGALLAESGVGLNGDIIERMIEKPEKITVVQRATDIDMELLKAAKVIGFACVGRDEVDDGPDPLYLFDDEIDADDMSWATGESGCVEIQSSALQMVEPGKCWPIDKLMEVYG